MKRLTLGMLSSEAKELVQTVYAKGSVPISSLYGVHIMNPLNRFLTIDWPQGAIVKNGYSKATPVIRLTEEGEQVCKEELK